MTLSGRSVWLFAGLVSAFIAACGGESRAVALAATAAAVPAPAQATGSANDPCPLTVAQVEAITGTSMTSTPGGCTFFPANGRDMPRVFYVLQNAMVCGTIKPGDLGFTEAVAGLAARAAYVRDLIDGSHVLVCRDGNARAFDVVVNLRNDKAANRAAAIALAKQVLAGR